MKNRWRNTLVIGLLSTSLLACGEETGSVESNESPIPAEEEDCPMRKRSSPSSAERKRTSANTFRTTAISKTVL